MKDASKTIVMDVPVEKIGVAPNPRGKCDAGAMKELIESVRQHGLLQPLVCCKEENGGDLVLVAGTRRLFAAKAGAGTVTRLLTSTEHAPPLYPREPWRALLEAEKPKVDQKQTGGPSTGVDTGGATVNGR